MFARTTLLTTVFAAAVVAVAGVGHAEETKTYGSTELLPAPDVATGQPEHLQAIREAETKKAKDRAAILAQAGAYHVQFQFEETVALAPNYKLTDRYDPDAMELIVVVEDSEDRIVLQHVLQTGIGVIKHWRQDWHYEPKTVREYKGHNRWVERKLSKDEREGVWSQHVYQVDDSPRYVALGKWEHHGQFSEWDSATTWRPLPRREHSKRSDYHVLPSANRVTITPTGWTHEQDNSKLVLDEQGKPVRYIAREVGVNLYNKIYDEQLVEAAEWWQDRKQYWADVRAVWADVYDANPELKLRRNSAEAALNRDLFELDDKVAAEDGYDSKQVRQRIRAVIDNWVTDTRTAAAN